MKVEFSQTDIQPFLSQRQDTTALDFKYLHKKFQAEFQLVTTFHLSTKEITQLQDHGETQNLRTAHILMREEFLKTDNQLLNSQNQGITVLELNHSFKYLITHQIYNGAQKLLTDKPYKMEEHQLLSIQKLISIVKLPTTPAKIILNLQLET